MKQNKHFTTIFIALICSIVFFTSGKAQVINCNSQECIDYYGSLGYTSVTSITINGGNLDLTPLSTITTVTGNLVIWGTEMTNLNGLEITSIGGNLEIKSNAALTNIDGLQNITTIGGDIYIWNNPALTTLNGLQNVTSVGNSLAIITNNALTNLDGLESISSVGGHVQIGANTGILNLAGLESLTTIGGHLSVSMNDALTNLIGLESLTSVGIHLAIDNNHALTDLTGLGSISSVGEDVNIQHNALLTNVDGLESLSSVGGFLMIWYSNSLTNLDGLESLSSVVKDLHFTDNPQLVSFCGLYPFLAAGPSNFVNIYNNGANPTVAEIIAAGPCVNVYNGDISLMSQQAVNDFGSSGYTSITGNLYIGYGEDIVDLTPLNTITSIGGYFSILYNNILTNLNGLNSLTSIGGTLTIGYNPLLADIGGLVNLSSVGNDITIQGNTVLTDLDGLESITSVSGELTINGNPALTNLNGLTNITSVGLSMVISYNTALTDLDGLGSITSVGLSLAITYNTVLTNLNGLGSITSVGDMLSINSNTALTNLDGLESLTNVGGSIFIPNNSVLTSFCGLHPFLAAGATNYVYIANNGANPTVAEIIDGGPCAPDVTVVDVDIYPENCPNELNVKGKGAISVALLGTDDFDVQNIDPTTLLLEGISPLRWGIEDVATPVSNGEQCDCNIDGPDGFADLTLKFDAKSLIAALGEVNNGDELSLTMTGNLVDGTAFEGSDCVIIAGKKLGKDLDGNLSSVPEEYALFENYPNPFNPSTKISWQSPEGSWQTIKVFDVLGNEVVTLVDEFREAGRYEVEFNAADLPSGVYMYRMQAGEYVQTKKMLLLK